MPPSVTTNNKLTSEVSINANVGCLRAAKLMMVESNQASPGGETTLLQEHLLQDGLSEEEWRGMHGEMEACRTLAWTVQQGSCQDWKWQKKVLCTEGGGRGTPT